MIERGHGTNKSYMDNPYVIFADPEAQKMEARFDPQTRAKLYQLASCIHTPLHKPKQREIEDTTIKHVVIDILEINRENHEPSNILYLYSTPFCILNR